MGGSSSPGHPGRFHYDLSVLSHFQGNTLAAKICLELPGYYYYRSSLVMIDAYIIIIAHVVPINI